MTEWRVPRSHAVAKGIGALLFVALGLLRLSDPVLVLLAAVAAVGCVVLAVRDVLAPVRLAADGDGVTVVSGFGARVVIPWDAVERLRVDVRHRYGRRTALLEIDTAERLHLLSRYDLGVAPEEALAELRLIRSGRSAAAE